MLGKANCHLISRKSLINIAIDELNLSFKQAAGLVDRGIHELKKQGLVLSSGRPKHISYVFSLSIKNDEAFQLIIDEKLVLSSEKETLEKELSMISYELEAYQELLKKIPHKKLKIIKLQQDTLEKTNQLNGKLRAINQLLSH
ncbi:hypothetical protein [Pantoea sp. MBLJ3]|uniref:hypothetical protein n=1 Tax=Pantoea sp. MBLJ3 TaxID=1562889 RepID=UPI0012DFFB65|nr:hypothetical protein [Pantoea sp. MBLJ3]